MPVPKRRNREKATKRRAQKYGDYEEHLLQQMNEGKYSLDKILYIILEAVDEVIVQDDGETVWKFQDDEYMSSKEKELSNKFIIDTTPDISVWDVFQTYANADTMGIVDKYIRQESSHPRHWAYMDQQGWQFDNEVKKFKTAMIKQHTKKPNIVEFINQYHIHSSNPQSSPDYSSSSEELIDLTGDFPVILRLGRDGRHGHGVAAEKTKKSKKTKRTKKTKRAKKTRGK